MSKHLKSLIIACLVACMTVCLGIFAAACTDGDDDKFPESVSVTVLLEDGTPAVGVTVQLCATGANGLCLEEKKTNEQGVATIEIPDDLGKDYEVHILKLDTVYNGEYQYVDTNGTPYATGKGIQIDVTKNSTPTITLKSTVGTEAKPLALTLDTTAQFCIGWLVEEPDMTAPLDDNGNRPTVLKWNREKYYSSLTVTTEGTYKITVTTSLDNETIDEPTVSTPHDTLDTDVYSFPTSNTSNGNAYSFNYDLLAGKTYKIVLSGLDDYKTVANGAKSISYSIKVEAVEDTNTDNIELSIGANNIPALVYGAPVTCTFNGTANATYTIAVTLEAGDWSVDNQILMDKSTTVTANADGLVSFVLGYEGFDDDSGNFTLTLTAAN